MGVSRTNLQGLANDLASLGCFVNAIPIRFKNHRDGFLKIRTSFLERGSLRVGTRQFLDEADVALGHLLEYGRQIQVHRLSYALAKTRPEHAL